MNKERKQKIEQLAVAQFEASETMRMLQQMNVPDTYEKRKKAAVDFAIATAELRDANIELEKELSDMNVISPLGLGRF